MPYGRDLIRSCFSPMQIGVGRDSTISKTLTVRPCTLIVLVLIVVGLAAAAGSMWIPSTHRAQQAQYIAQLQYEQRNRNSKISELEAMLALRDAQLESMLAEALRNAHDMRVMNKRLAMFDDVLAARKVGGWHILHPIAQWLDKHTIAYSLVVVKGENYPRWAKGHIRFSVMDAKGQSIALENKAGKRSLRFDVTTHVFFEGEIPWAEDWQAKVLTISLFDKRGKNNQQIEIPIVGHHQLKPDLSKNADLDGKGLKHHSQIQDMAAPKKKGEAHD